MVEALVELMVKLVALQESPALLDYLWPQLGLAILKYGIIPQEMVILIMLVRLGSPALGILQLALGRSQILLEWAAGVRVVMVFMETITAVTALAV